MKQEYIYIENDIVNVIQCKPSANSKLGFGLVIQTYHFSIEQVETAIFENDSKNCLDCPLSFTNNFGKSGGCYTHNFRQKRGLISMLKRLHRLYISGEINPFNLALFEKFYNKINSPKYDISLCRFGAYGEPVLLGELITAKLAKIARNITGYSHQYNKPKFYWANRFFMASVHSDIERKEAQKIGFRSFFVKDKNTSSNNTVICPASKESGYKSSCIACALCSGNFKGLKKDISIDLHN